MTPSHQITVVGTGIQQGTQITREAEWELRNADKVFALLHDDLAVASIAHLNSNVESLVGLYDTALNRRLTYAKMTRRILDGADQFQRIVVAFYGHPVVFVFVTRELVHEARSAAVTVRVLPGVSAEDCMFADLGLDPGLQGCQSYEATEFLVHARRYDENTPLVLWQVGAIGQKNAVTQVNRLGLEVLSDALMDRYPPDHVVVAYVASSHPIEAATIVKIRLADLAGSSVPPWSTLYVPPLGVPPVRQEVLDRLGFERFGDVSTDMLIRAPYTPGVGAYALPDAE